MRDRWLLPCVVVAACLMPVGVRGDEPRPSAAQIDRLIRQLGNEVFSEREEASRQLKKIGPAAMPALRTAIKGKDAEVSRRAADIAVAIENTLEQLVIDYRAFGLPLPPKDAKLVRVNGYNSGTLSELAFQLKPASGKNGPILLEGSYEQHLEWIPTIQEVEPKLEAVKNLDLGLDPVGLAIHCYDRGWHKLAEHILEQAQKSDHDPPRLQLLHAAWNYWEGKLTHPKIDRAPIAKRLKELIARDEAMNTEGSRAFLKSLELALVPSKAKPGSIEALIDDLVDYGADSEGVGCFQTEARYLRIVERGFDAVPALIEHLDDERLTRGREGGFNNFFGYHLEVRHVVSDLLEGLAGREIDRDWVRRLQGSNVDKVAAKKWWTEARKIGEEAYLLKHVFRDAASKDGEGHLNGEQLQVIMVKYPQRLPALYRTSLDKALEFDSIQMMFKAVARSKLPAQDKLDLLKTATKHKDMLRCVYGFLALKDVDKKEFNSFLLATIEAFPKDVPGPYATCREVILVRLVMDSDDPRLWTAIEKVAKRSAVGLRMELLNRFGDPDDTNHRLERLRLVAAFLEDATIRDRSTSDKYVASDEPRENVGLNYNKLAVRDFAALELADLLGIDVELKPERTSDEWAKLRRLVREAVDRELSPRK